MMLRILASLFLSVLFASSVCSMTMDEAVDYALKNNPDLTAFSLEEEVTLSQGIKARLPLRANPTIESGVSTKGKSPVEPGTKRFTDYGIKVSQEFEIAGQRSARIGIAEKDLGRIRHEIRNRERVLTAEVKDTFTRAIARKEKIALTREVIEIQGELLGYTRAKFQAGDVSSLQVNLAEVEFAKARREHLLAENEYRENRSYQFCLLGLQDPPK